MGIVQALLYLIAFVCLLAHALNASVKINLFSLAAALIVLGALVLPAFF